ncbi:MAG: acyltransferase family protein [Bacteroidota bacterium]|nr:acyltransferase family protein [Bacteroidota bacterium]
MNISVTNKVSPEPLINEATGNHRFYPDVIRAIACLIVVFLHASGAFLLEWGGIAQKDWMVANVIDSMARICVPFFVMLSGALILHKQESYHKFFKKRASRLLIPFIFWPLFYLGWRILYQKEALSIGEAIISLFDGSVYYHLWYLYMIIGLYAIAPLLRKLLAVTSKLDIRYFLGLWILFSSLIPTIQFFLQVIYKNQIDSAFDLPFATGFIGYFILGDYLRKIELSAKQVKVAWCLFVVGSLMTCIGTYILTLSINDFEEYLYNYCSPTVIIQSVSAYLLLKYYAGKSENRIGSRSKKIISRIGQVSLGVYLIHPIFLDLLFKAKSIFSISPVLKHPALFIPLSSLIGFIFSVTACILISKTPFLYRCINNRRS